MVKRECPKCGKLYVREEAFRKHVSSCRRTKMISKRERQYDGSQPSWASGTRKFDGKTYTYATSFRDKREADHWAGVLRKQKNVSARVVKGTGWSTKYQRRVTMYRVYGRSRNKRS